MTVCGYVLYPVGVVLPFLVAPLGSPPVSYTNLDEFGRVP
jgi:hypothetical protein